MVSRRLYASVRMDSKKPKHLRISQLFTSYHNPLPSPSMKKQTMWCPGKALTWGLQVVGIMMAFKATHPDEIAWGVCTGAERSPRWRAWAASASRALRKETPAEEVMGEGKRRRISNNGLTKEPFHYWLFMNSKVTPSTDTDPSCNYRFLSFCLTYFTQSIYVSTVLTNRLIVTLTSVWGSIFWPSTVG